MSNIDMTRIASNIGALNALNSLNGVNTRLGIAQTRLATGKRINTSEDDPAGYALGTKLRARVSGLETAMSSIGDAKNMLAVMDGGLRKAHDLLISIREKAEQAVSDTMSSDERSASQATIEQYLNEINDIVTRSEWNGTSLLNASVNKVIQTGSNSGDTTTVDVSQSHTVTSLGLELGSSGSAATAVTTIANTVLSYATAAVATGNAQLASGTYTVQVTVSGLTASFRLLDQYGNAVAISSNAGGTGSLTSSAQDTSLVGPGETWDTGRGLVIQFDTVPPGHQAGEGKVNYAAAGGGVDSSATATAYLASIDSAIQTVSNSLNKIGSFMARFTAKEEQMAVAHANTEAAYNRVFNADMAKEQVEATKYLILQQVATSMLAQANSAPQSILSLFR